MKRILCLLFAASLALGAGAKTQKQRYAVTVEGVRAECPVVLGDVPQWARSVVVTTEGREIPSQLDKALG